MSEGTVYVKLRDESGSYWSPSLGVKLVRSIPGKLPESVAKALIKKGVIVKTTEEDYYNFHEEAKKKKEEAKITAANELKLRKKNAKAIIKLAKEFKDEGLFTEAISEIKKVLLILPDEEEVVSKFIDACDLEIEEVETLRLEKEAEAKTLILKEKAERDGIQKVIDACIEKGVITKKGSWLKFGEVTLGNGNDDTIDILLEDEELLSQLKEKMLVQVEPEKLKEDSKEDSKDDSKTKTDTVGSQE